MSDDTVKKQKNISDEKPEKVVKPEETSEELIEAQKKIESLQKEIDEITLRWKRALADYQNLEKRTEEQKQEFVQFALKKFLEKFLSSFDDLELAGKHLKDKGLDLALKKLAGILKEVGLERIETENKDYDIHLMEAINIIEGKEDNKVVTEHRAGYLMHGSVLRPAQVTVSKKS